MLLESSSQPAANASIHTFPKILTLCIINDSTQNKVLFLLLKCLWHLSVYNKHSVSYFQGLGVNPQ